jgi:outer membrane receptor for ferric coprogen and ferric-rhodotorulic acid
MGGSLFSYRLTGESYTVPQDAKETNNFTPYIGAVYDLGDTHSVYASYSKIYMPQNDIGTDLKALAPLEGKNHELGVKSEWLDKKLNSTFSLFRTEQKNQPRQIGTSGTRPINEGIEATSKGYELDLAGELTERLSLNAGYTRLMSVKGDQGQSVNTFSPKHLAHVSAVYRLPYIENLKVGASLNWQSAVHVDIGTVRYAQDAYAILNLMAQYKIDNHWDAAINVYNVTDEKYLSSLRYSSSGQGYYAPPLNALATLTWRY